MLKNIIFLLLILIAKLNAVEGKNHGNIELFPLDIIAYEDFFLEDPDAMKILKDALFNKGIVGIKGTPGYVEKLENYIQASRTFFALTEEIKEQYAPSSSPNKSLDELFIGYQKGKERFMQDDGSWVPDDLKSYYYAFFPNLPINKWPAEVDIETPFLEISELMSEIGKMIIKKINLFEYHDEQSIDKSPSVGRMLYYCKSKDAVEENPYWCGTHYDFGLFTALLPSFYFINDVSIPEPAEAGLFVRARYESNFKKVVADDPSVMFFQVGEFGQLMTNDKIRATEHRVHKASGEVERYTMVLFFTAPDNTLINSTSELTKDPRYGKNPCSYIHWKENSLKQ